MLNNASKMVRHVLSDIVKIFKLSIDLISKNYYDLEELLLGLLSRLIQNDEAVSRIYSKIIYERGYIAERGDLLYLKYDGLKWVVRKNIYADLKFGPLLCLVGEPYQCWAWFRKYLDMIESFIDVGAYIGGYSVRACNKGIDTYAIEANPENARLLLENLAMNCDNSAFNFLSIAAGSKREIRLLNIPCSKDGYLTSSLVERRQEHDDRTRRVEVEVYPLDSIINAERLRLPVLLKIDVEGFEIEVIEGAKRLLQKVDYIMIETSGTNRRIVDKLLSNFNFKVADNYKSYLLYERMTP
jgi:FkbM family methyltransferase